MMNERNFTQMQLWLGQKKAACLAAHKALAGDNRGDEAVLEKIRANVYDLSSAVLGAAVKQKEPAAFFLRRMEEIPVNWLAARDRALQHQDEVQAHIETIKLDTAEEIRSAFRQIWSEEA
jgi:hypothetical protein